MSEDDDVEIVIRCPRADAPVIAGLFLSGATRWTTPETPEIMDVAESLSDSIFDGLGYGSGIQEYIRTVDQLIDEAEPADCPPHERFEVSVRDGDRDE